MPLGSFSQKTGKEFFKAGYMKYNNGEYNGALADFSKAIELKYENLADVHYYSGLCNLEMKKYEDAIKEFSMELRISNRSDSVKALSYRGLAKFNMLDFQSALEDLDKAVAMNSSCVEAYKFRGDLKKAIGKIDEACTDWHKARDLGDAEAAQNFKFYCY